MYFLSIMIYTFFIFNIYFFFYFNFFKTLGMKQLDEKIVYVVCNTIIPILLRVSIIVYYLNIKKGINI